MGYYYAELAPPAILFDNPGITANEFSNILLKEDIPGRMLVFDEPIYTLPRILCLPTNQSYKEFHQIKKDPQGVPLGPPRVCLLDKPYIVELHVRNELSSPKTFKQQRIKKEEISDNQIAYLDGPDYWPSEPECLVKHVINKKKIKLLPGDWYYSEFDEDSNEVLEYEFVGQEITKKFEQQIFDSKEELLNKWPIFRPENIFNFSISSGIFYTGNMLMDNFRWKQVNGRYYFDERSFDLMPAGGQNVRRFGVGYTDLVITAEAIKNKGTDLLTYNTRDGGEENLQSFIETLPEISRRRIEVAIWDAHTSTFAKENCLTYFEMLHLRAPHDSP